MSNAEQIATVLYSTAGLIALWFLSVSWRGYKTDKLRQDIFRLREELFDYALSGEVSFTNSSYVRLRMLLNSMIRFAHEISFIRLAVTALLAKVRPMSDQPPSILAELDADPCLTTDVRENLKSIHTRLMGLVATQVLTTSLWAGPVFGLYCAYSLVTVLPKRRPVPPVKLAPPVSQVLLDRRISASIQLIEQQAIETRERQLQEKFATAGAR